MVGFLAVLSLVLGSMVFLTVYALTNFTNWEISFAIGFAFSILWFSGNLINEYYEIKIRIMDKSLKRSLDKGVNK